ncbi:MAG: gamma-glutamylcyclotransferase family protein [Janthinobacterium lividum]
MPHRVFVYGTLKEGFPNFDNNLGKRVPGTFKTVQRFALYLVGYRHSPWLLHSESQGAQEAQVEGQVFEVDDDALQAMDRLERIDMPDGYRRLTIHVVALDDLKRIAVPVHAYLKPADMLPEDGIMLGPLTAYELSHAALYTPRSAPAAGVS